LARTGRRSDKPAAAPRTLTVRIETIGVRGDGVGHTDDGTPVFVPLSAPGDLLRIEAQGERGAITAVLEAGAARAAPPCRLYGACGGCALQHIAPGAYAAWKMTQVETALSRSGVRALVIRPIVPAPAASRRRASFAVTKRNGVCLGFNARRSNEIVDIDDCVVLAPDLSSRLDGLRALAAAISGEAFDLAVTLCDNGLDVNIIAPRPGLLPMSDIARLSGVARAADVVRLSLNGAVALELAPPIVTFDGIAVSPPPGAFLQASREGADALIGLVRRGIGGARKAVDLFAGCGTFSLPLARTASVLALDSDRAAIEALKRAGAAAQGGAVPVKPLRAQTRDLFERPLSAKELKGFDAIVFDPPRAGAAEQAAEIAKSGVRTVVGVSCNPVTFARDAGLLVAGGYRLLEVTPVDQFVYSAHVELVGVFSNR